MAVSGERHVDLDVVESGGECGGDGGQRVLGGGGGAAAMARDERGIAGRAFVAHELT